MSALPPKAEMCGAAWDVRFGSKRTFALHLPMSAYPRKRTCAMRKQMSALGQKRTSGAGPQDGSGRFPLCKPRRIYGLPHGGARSKETIELCKLIKSIR